MNRSSRRKEALTCFRFRWSLLTSAATSVALFSAAFASFAIDPVLTVNGLNANYTTTHVFVDEVAGDSVPLTIVFTPNTGSLTQIETFSNLNRRDRAALDADGDGVEDGILPPGGDLVTSGSDAHYFKSYSMTDIGGGQFQLVLNAQKTGAYRLTARYKVAGNTNWIYYNNFSGQRDHCIVVSPKRARDIVLYELNAINVEAQGTNLADRSTFVDLWDGPGARSYNATTTKFNLGYVTNLGVNWLWFQPVHPPGIDGRENDPATGSPYEVGSPYAVKNFFEIQSLMSKANSRSAALEEFTNFVAAADGAGVGIMLDAAFNHTAHDCELADSGVYYFASNAAPTSQIRSNEARFYSRTDAYDMRASSAANIAVAPDRYDFGKWNDVKDVYFGRYAALVANSGQSGNQLNESDWFDSTIGNENSSGGGNGHFDAITRNVWRYFVDYILFWLDKTGCPVGTPASQTEKGIDGLRADFGQGLPPQCWEYIINKTRSRKWNFVFMSESLDGGPVTYRSNRHFDMLNENIVFDFKGADDAADYRNIFEGRRASYGQGLVLLNTTSHDEESYEDPFQPLVRYTVGATVDGAPMIFYGQEQGISRTFGFSRYEVNFGKQIPHFKKHNSMQPVLDPANRNFGLDQIYHVYAAVGQARQFSRALRSSNRYFLNLTSGSTHQQLYAVAKFETANASPNLTDVVFAFANLDRDNNHSGSFNVNILSNGSNLFGIKSNRTYNVKNIAAYTAIDGNRRNVWLWGAGGLTGTNVLANGIFAGLNKVPNNNAGWTNAPFEAQYLKLYDVTPPPTPAAPTSTKAYAIGTTAQFNWSPVADPEGGILGYRLIAGTAPGGSNTLNTVVGGTSQSVTGSIGQTLYASVAAVNNAGIEGSRSPNSSGVLLLDPTSDQDGDGMTNAAEDTAGTDPLNPGSVLRILNLTTEKMLTWSSISGKTYRVLATSELKTNFAPVSGDVNATNTTTTYWASDLENSAFYRIQVIP
jgi:glycosidase